MKRNEALQRFGQSVVLIMEFQYNSHGSKLYKWSFETPFWVREYGIILKIEFYVETGFT